jgi:hypothetical protein
MIVSRQASESIRNMNEIEDSNKNRNEVCNMMEQHPNMLENSKYTTRNENNINKASFKILRKK